ncbi:hypothetical protein RSOLAG1IB_00621 [Rhizoctonia solani AG-1 IB]|uniref:Uncharacterized protein n=1 Tax=Thanatephorus cucumeris (strain AG1-IB / isolate 7/3/14) TaxID=1108050 RepID=A0A0B7F5B2_THACB|nr:hypothetical protein RSOLAG1IB_00621 [Rhizoctonia solani AG-1 IB]
MPITLDRSSSIVSVDERTTYLKDISSEFTLSSPPRKRRNQRTRAGSVSKQSDRCTPGSPICSRPTRRRASVSSRPLLSPFLSLVDSRSTAYGINTAVQLSSFVLGKSRPRSSSGPIPCTALSFDTDFAPSSGTPVTGKLSPSPGRSPSSFGIASPIHVLFQRSCALAKLKGDSSAASTTITPPKARSKARPTPIMTSGKNGHVNVLLLPKSRDKDGNASIRSGTSASTNASKSKSRKALDHSSSKGSKTPNPSLRAQRSLTPARGATYDTFRPLPYATHAALDEFFGDPRKMNALHAHQSTPDQLGARPGEVGYGGSVAHRGPDGWIWFDAIEEQEYAWLMGEAESPRTPETARQPKEKKPKKRSLFGRRGSVASVSSGGRSDWESFDAFRRGSESGTSEAGIVEPTTYDLDPTRPPRYRTPTAGAPATYRVAALDTGAWDAALHSHVRQNVGGTSTPKCRRGRSRRGSSSKGNSEERRRPAPLNLTAVTNTLAALGPLAVPSNQPTPPTSRRASLPANCLLPPSLSDVARADFVSSSYQPHPSKRDLNLDPETPWSANLPKETIYRSIGSGLDAPGVTPASPFKAMFSRRASFTPLPLRHSPAPLPKPGHGYEVKGIGHNGTLPKLPPMPAESGAPAVPEARRKTSLADIFRRGFGAKGSRK